MILEGFDLHHIQLQIQRGFLYQPILTLLFPSQLGYEQFFLPAVLYKNICVLFADGYNLCESFCAYFINTYH